MIAFRKHFFSNVLTMKHIYKLLIAVAFFINLIAPASAQTVWSPAAGSNWNTAGNWSLGVPTAATIAQFNANPTSGSVTLNAAANAAAINITSAHTVTLTITNSALSSNSITLAGATINSQPNTVIANNAGSNGTVVFKTGGLSMQVNIGAGNFIVAGAGTSLASGNTISISSTLAGSDPTFLGSGTWNGTTGLNGGVLKLSGSNTGLTGTVIVGAASSTYNSGVLELAATGALPAGTGVTINPFSQLYLNASGTFTGGSLSLTGTGNNASAYGRGALRSSTAASQWGGDVTLAGSSVIYTGGTLTLAGNLGGTASLTKEGSGNLVLKGTGNTHSGDVTITAGTVTVASGSALANSNITLSPSAGVSTTLALNNSAQPISSLSSSFTSTTGTFTNTLALGSGHTLTIDQSANTTFGKGAVATLTSIITGNATVVKSGTGRLILNNGGHTFYGGLTITAGELRFCPAASTTLGTGTNYCPLNMQGGIFATTGITASVVCNLGVLNNISDATITLDSATVHTLNFTGLGTNTGLLTVTGWKGSFNGTTGTKGKLFIGSSATLTSGQLAQIQFTDGVRTIPATQLSTGEIVPLAPINITSASYGPFTNDVDNTISVLYSTPATYFTGAFKVQLSGATGTFSNYTSNIIGTGTSATSGTIIATIPAGTPGSSAYRVRVVNSAPYSVGSDDNGSDIQVNNALPIVTSVNSYTNKLPGDTITIAGSLFDTVLNNNLVYFGPVKSYPVAGSSTVSLKVPVPFGAVLGPIGVYDTTSKLVGTSAGYFVPGFNSTYFEAHSFNFQPRQDYMVRLCPNIAAVGDLDGDNLPDLVTVNKISRNISILQNTGGGVAAYDTVLVLACQGNPSNVKIADIDGDGRQDIVVASGSGGSSIMIFRNTTNFSSVAPRTISFATRSDIVISSISTHPGVLGIGDFDNDGKLDIAAACYAPSSPYKMVILRNNNNAGATSSFTLYGYNTGSSSTPSSAATSSLCVGDFNSDGLPDIGVVTQNGYAAAGVLSVFKNTSTGQGIVNFASPLALSTGVFPLDVQCGDMDGDGKLDLVTTQSLSNSVSVFRNTYISGSSLSFASETVVTSSMASPAGAAIGDLDGDGKADIVAANFTSTGSVTILRNNSTAGSLSFTNLGNWATNPYPAGVTIADLDLDGYPEIITGNTGNDAGNTISIFRNTPVPIIGTISPSSTSVCQGASTTMTYSLALPDGETGYWTSSNTSVATIDAATGMVYGVSSGNTTISYTVTVTNGSISRSTTATLTVNLLPAVTLTGFNNVCQGGTTTLNGSPSGGSWSHANAVATVSSSGAVTGVASTGTDVITYTYTSGLGCTNIDTQAVSIIAAPNAGTITGADSFCTGATSVYTSSGDAGGKWFSSSDFVLTIDSLTGVGTGNGEGYVSIMYKLTSGCGVYTADKIVYIKGYPEMANISDPTTMCVGQSISLEADIAGGEWTSSDTDLATVTSSGIVTALATGTPEIFYTITNECGATNSYTTITINDVPATPPAITGTPTLCVDGLTTLSNATAGGTWTSSNPGIATVNASGVVYGVSVGNLQISYTTSNACGSSAPATVAVAVVGYPDAAIASAAAPCTGHTTSIVFGGTNDATITYNIDGGSDMTGTLTGGTYTYTTGAISGPHVYMLHTVSNGYCTTLKDTFVTVSPQAMAWVGGAAGAETDWNTAANWSCGVVPVVTDDVLIPSATYMPVLGVSGTGNVQNITVNSIASVTLNTGSVLNVKGNITNNGIITGVGKVTLNGIAGQALSGHGVIAELQLDNAAGAYIDTPAKVMITRVLTVSAGQFNTNDSLELGSSDTAYTARIDVLPSANSITGRIIEDQYVQGGYRRFRFWSHPFTHAISLSQIQQYIDITGPGGSSNGFTSTVTNAPSAFRYDPYTGNSSMSYDPGWKPFTKINALAADSNKLRRYQGIRLFFRGAKGQGLTSSYAYSPLPVTVKMTGYVNQGPQTIHMAKGTLDTLEEFNMIGNPYPSPVDIGTVIYNAKQSGNVNGSAFYVFNSSLGVGGQYMAIPFGTSAPIPYYLQANSCFQVRAAHDGDSLNFVETNKGAEADNYLFKSPSDYLVLHVYDTSYHMWDELRVQFNSQATDKNDARWDATKLMGADLNFYSLSAEGRKLSIDARPYAMAQVVPLGIKSAYQQEFIIRADQVTSQGEAGVVLHDKLLNKYISLNEGAEYRFVVSSDNNTQGDNRFELAMKATETTPDKIALNVMPNPATDNVIVSVTARGNEPTTIRITDVSGVTIYTNTFDKGLKTAINIPLNTVVPGIYLVEMIQGDTRITKKLVKE
jgi:autotransporter-associated beta strand protein